MPRSRLNRCVWHIPVFRVLGLILLLAAALKSYQLATQGLPAQGFFTSRWLLIGLAEGEIALGLWLWFGFFPRLTRWLALAWFAALLGVSLPFALTGQGSCTCFGSLRVMPWVVSLLDFCAVVMLAMVPIAQAQSLHRLARWKLPAVLGLYFLIAIPSGLAMARGLDGTPALEVSRERLDLGVLLRGGSMASRFSLRNRGSKPVEIASVQTSCSCLDVRLPVLRLDPGQVMQAVAQIDLQDRQEFQSDLAIEAWGKTSSGNLAFRIIVAASVNRD